MDPNESFTIIYEIYEELGIVDKKEFVSLIRIPALYETYIDELLLMPILDYKSFIDALDGSTRSINLDHIRLMMALSNRGDTTNGRTFGHNLKPSATTKEGYTALMKLINVGAEDLANEFIIKYGTDCNPSNTSTSGDTALNISCSRGYDKVSSLLINTFGFYCNPTRIDSYCMTALLSACRNGSYQIVNLMLDTFGISCFPVEDRDLYIYTSAEAIDDLKGDDQIRCDIIKKLMKLGLPFNGFDSECLMFAGVEFLGDKFDPSVRMIGNQTFLIYACRYGHYKFAIHLIRTYGLKCDPSATDKDYITALIGACRNNNPSVAIELLKTFGKECNINMVDDDGGTALIYATENGLNDVIELINKLNTL